MARACFVLEAPLEERDAARYGFERFRARGWSVSVLDLTEAVHPGFGRPAGTPPGPEVTTAADWRQADAAVAAAPDALWIVMAGYGSGTAPLYKILEDRKAPYLQFCCNSLPVPGGSPWGGAWRRLSRGGFRRLASSAWAAGKAALSSRAAAAPSPWRVVVDGRRHKPNYPGPPDAPKKIWAHTLDYDLFLARNEPGSVSGGPYILFLDEYFPFHPDNALHPGTDPGVSPDAYYGFLRRSFERLESLFGWPVVIAAHPRSRYEEHPDYFRGRRVEKGRTPELAAGAGLVLLHSSTSVNFAVLNRKPVMFLADGALRAAYQGPYIEFMARQFGKRPVDPSRERALDPAKELEAPEPLYAAYMENYIKTPESPRKPFWDIVLDEVGAGRAP